MYSSDEITRIEQLRAFAQQRRLTVEEQAESIRLVRQDRVGASYASAAAKTRKAAAAPADGQAILAAMMQAVGGAKS